ncbi:UDP-galactose translocator [Toxocara canis]|nr:UDP-galactose translocator [Toxocara canis]
MDDAIETAKVCVPAVIYTLQNNLYYIALSHLEATTFCLAYQMKIFTTALFLRFMLKRNLSVQQWFALLLLAIGVADVQIQYEPPSSAKRIQQYPIIGFLAVISMCFTSAFAGVYLEKVLKQSSINIWMQNVRLSLLGIPMSAISVFVSDYDLVARGEMFRGFDTLVWIMTITNSVGGLLISIVIKYADNILKAYAQSMAIVGAAIGSWIIFDFVPNLLFTFGALAVIISVYIYTAYPYVDYEQIVQTTKDRITINK